MKSWLTIILILGNISIGLCQDTIQLVTGKSFVANIKSIDEKKVIFSIPDEADMTYIPISRISKITMQSGEVLLWENHYDMLTDSVAMADKNVGSNKKPHHGKEQGSGWDSIIDMACNILFAFF